MSKIKLLICYHKKAPLFKDEILTPIHVGRANARKRMDSQSESYQWLMENMIGDDTGENISDRNDFYNEMTALYWAWKNYETLGNPDYIGLMHYRRHFVLKPGVQAVYDIKNFDEETYYEILNYSEEKMYQLVEGYDFLTHIGKVNNVYSHYIENQRKEDIDLATEIMLEMYPEYEETMKEYYAGDYSNFCNMSIFSRQIFFQYCEWIFSILGEFEKRVNVSEKRFFISERLTGIFVAKLMKDEKLKYEVLPIAFIEESTEVPIAISIDTENELNVATAITSVLTNSNGYNSFHFYLFCESYISEEVKKRYKFFEKKYEKCIIEFVECEIAKELLPLYISELLPKVNKCIYMCNQVIALQDIGEFYRICSVDDYYIVGIPNGDYKPEEKEKCVAEELMVINCRRMRMHEISKLATEKKMLHKEGNDILNILCKNEIGYIPWYLFTSERISEYGKALIDLRKTRASIQEETLWRPFLIYDETDPIINNQGVYSIFWWDIMKKIPFSFQKLQCNLVALESVYTSQQIEANYAKEKGRLYVREGVSEYIEETKKEEWRNYNILGKLRFYYRHNGMKNTIAYVGKRVLGKRG